MRTLFIAICSLFAIFAAACTTNYVCNGTSTTQCTDPGPDAGAAGDVCPMETPVRCGPDHPCEGINPDCAAPSYSCGGAVYSCVDQPGDYASCCDGEFYTCPIDDSYYCPATKECLSYLCDSAVACTENGFFRQPCTPLAGPPS